MRMVIGLYIAAIIGLAAEWMVALTGYPIPPVMNLKRHFIWAINSSLWNLLIQSTLMFMWISLPRQIHEQVTKFHSYSGKWNTVLFRNKSRMLRWIGFGILFLMIPLFTGMMKVTGVSGLSMKTLGILHTITAWWNLSYLTTLVFAEGKASWKLLEVLSQAQDLLSEKPNSEAIPPKLPDTT